MQKSIPKNLHHAALRAIETGENLEIIERYNKEADYINFINSPY